MATKTSWDSLDHTQKVDILRDNSVDQILRDYSSNDDDPVAFRARLVREMVLWQPQQTAGIAKQAGSPPNKEVVLGAWRDLDRAEALLELIDNSIDAWSRRKERHPDKCAPELNIHIDIDADIGQLSYEDNAGGVPVDKLENLVVPGHSETDALTHSIGSYKTGGKKAIFRLATAANITTCFWNPAETGDSAVTVHLDERWLTNVDEYKFPYYDVSDRGGLQRGQTRYLMQLRREPIGAHWYGSSTELENITREIKNTYGLLIARSGGAINIYFPKRGTKITPSLNNIYDFSGAGDTKVDIRPQRVEFQTQLEYEGKKHPLTIELVIGCRVSSAVKQDVGPGFDLYGNNRLFTFRDERLFADMLPKGGVTNLIRGWVNIIGPNVFVPWDTHKRHLNYDRDVIEIVRTNPAIKEVFESWGNAYKHISGIEVKKTIDVPYAISDRSSGALQFTHSDVVTLDPSKKRGQKLPEAVFRPVVPAKKTKKDTGIPINMTFTTDEARRLAAVFKVTGALDAGQTKKSLSEKAKQHLLSLIDKRPRKS